MSIKYSIMYIHDKPVGCRHNKCPIYSHCQKWSPGSDSVNSSLLQTGVLIRTRMYFFVEGLDLHTKCCTTVGIMINLFKESHAVTFIATEMLKKVLKLQGAP